MNVIVNCFGAEVVLKRPVAIEPASPVLKDVLPELRKHGQLHVERFVDERLAPVDASVLLVNGRNMLSLAGWETPVRDGDELTFMVPVAGG